MEIDFFDSFHYPMEPLSCTEIEQDEGFLHQVKWDGIRIISTVDKNRARLFNKHLQERTDQYIELHDLPGRINADNAVLDGEIVVLKEGKPSFPAVMRRANSSSKRQMALLQKICPIEYMVFDLLYLNGRSLMHLSLAERQKFLFNTIEEKDYLHQVESFVNGTGLFKAVENMEMEGIVSKDQRSPYIQGKKHRYWHKIKCKRLQNCILGGYTLRGRIVNSLLLGAYRDGNFYYIGKAGNGLDADSLQLLSQYLPDLEIKDSPFMNITQKAKDLHFLKPELGIQVEFMEWTDDLKLRFPIIKQFTAADADHCTF